MRTGKVSKPPDNLADIIDAIRLRKVGSGDTNASKHTIRVQNATIVDSSYNRTRIIDAVSEIHSGESSEDPVRVQKAMCTGGIKSPHNLTSIVDSIGLGCAGLCIRNVDSCKHAVAEKNASARANPEKPINAQITRTNATVAFILPQNLVLIIIGIL